MTGEEQMTVVAIDPGPVESAVVELGSNGNPFQAAIYENKELVGHIPYLTAHYGSAPRHLAIEWIEHMGMPAGADLFETAFWVGRIYQRYVEHHYKNHGFRFPMRIKRGEIKLELCGSKRAKDSNIRQALIDLYGGTEKAIGNRKCKRCKGKGWVGRGHDTCGLCEGSGWRLPPGPLHEVTGHCWQALAVAVVAQRTVTQRRLAGAQR